MKLGTTIKFKCGTGRGDEETIHEGIVNGEPIATDTQTFVLVHICETDQNVIVNQRNILGEET